jgi:hypothetical protein
VPSFAVLTSKLLTAFAKFYAKAHYTRGLACLGLVNRMRSQLPEASANTDLLIEKTKTLLELAREDMAAATAHTPNVANEL